MVNLKCLGKNGTPYLSENSVWKIPAPWLTKILTSAAINTFGWDGPQARVRTLALNLRPQAGVLDLGLGFIPASCVDCGYVVIPYRSSNFCHAPNLFT